MSWYAWRKPMTVRESYRKKIPKEWIKNKEKGLCPVCGKNPIEFEKGQKIYCSKKCNKEYSKCFLSWQEICEQIFKEREKKCQQCGKSELESRSLTQEEKKEKLREWAKNNKDRIEHQRGIELVRLDNWFKEKYDEIMDDVHIAEQALSWEEREKIVGSSYTPEIRMEVDHIKALINGGAMWDKDNLQILCPKCHNVKTKQDMAEYRQRKKNIV
jgi:5-methylcytosine-specific restriction endonuclease McrA